MPAYKRLGVLLEIVAAGLEQTHRMPVFCQFAGKGNAGRACADYTDICPQVLTFGHLQKIT